MKRWAALLATTLLSAGAQASEPQAADHARWLIEQGRYAPAREELKQQIQLYPESSRLHVLLAVGYLGDDNPFWAANTLTAWLQQNPADCEARVWLAWTYVHTASLDKVKEALDHESCRGPDPMATRAAIVGVMAADLERQQDQARAELDRARRQPAMFESDRGALRALSLKVDSERTPELAWQLEARRGYTTNALLGSPVDPTKAGSAAASSLLQLSAWVRVAPDLHSFVRPSLEVQARVFQLFAPDVEGQSYFNPTGRIGVFLGRRSPRALIAYRPDYLRLQGGDNYNPAPLWYVAAHRAETEIELTPRLLLFAGAGRREFRPVVRNRWELDGGIGGQWPLTTNLAAVWAISGRKHWSTTGAYDVVGGTGLGSVQYNLPGEWQARATVTLATDYYSRSAGYFAPDPRRDLFAKAGAALWSPAWEGLRAGLAYDFSHRDSTAPLYEFSDHRVVMMVAWAGNAELQQPALTGLRPSADIPWGLGEGKAAVQDRVQELLRQDEQTLQKSCGCRE
jgi:hypothetical protein